MEGREIEGTRANS